MSVLIVLMRVWEWGGEILCKYVSVFLLFIKTGFIFLDADRGEGLGASSLCLY